MTALRVLLVFVLSIPYVASAASEFVPIAPIPVAGGELNSNTTLGEYVNALFQIGIGIAAVSAVIQIAYGGYEYLLKDSGFTKKDGRERILKAFQSLLILLLVYIILYVINPDLVKLNVLNPSSFR